MAKQNPANTLSLGEGCFHYKDISQHRPLVADFDAAEHCPKSTFPYRWIVYGGNHWETLVKVTRPRGFVLVKSKDDNRLDDVDFIWRPLEFSPLVMFGDT